MYSSSSIHSPHSLTHKYSILVREKTQNLERESLLQATMVMTLRKRVPSIVPEIESESETPLRKKKTQKNLKSTKRRETFSSSESEFNTDSEKENESSIEYEKIREQRIRENRERMEKLGIFTLSSQVFNGNQKVGRRKNPQKKKRYPPLYSRVRDRSYDYVRRSSRLKDVPNTNYMETERSLKEMGIEIPDEWTTEVYTEEDEKLLGDFETIWTLEADGIDEDGDRVYNTESPPCHQCRQRRAGKFTYCGKCRTPQGQICGDCLYTRYGENVLEARQNPTWSCPACRGICNCSRCRRTKGWDPINIPHSKVIESGFKSVAHYLILTRRAGATPKELNDGAEVVDLTEEEKAAAPHNEGSDYSAEWSGAESDDSDSEDETKGEENEEEQPDENEKEQPDENQVASAEKSIKAANATDRDVL